MALEFDEQDQNRPVKEAALKSLSNTDLRALYDRTRAAAKKARAAKNMEKLFRLVRGTKTIQRIAGERGFIIRARLPRTVMS